MRQSKEKICGIYMWEFILPGKWFGGKYIGQSINIYKRQDSHRSDLQRNDHHNIKLQQVINKYGIKAFKFSILMQCLEPELNFWEKWFIKSFDTYKTRINFNLTEGGDIGSHNYRTGELQNMETGEIVKLTSIKEFCQKYNINCDSMISQVLDGKSKFAGDWFNPKLSWRPKTYQLKDPEGHVHSFCKMYKFCDKHNLDRVSVCGLISGKNIEHRGWTLPNPRKYNYESNQYSFLSPNGEIFTGKNISEFARKHGLIQTSLNQLMRGEISQHHGWKKYLHGDKIEKFEFKQNEYKLISPGGVIYITNNLTKLAKDNGIEPSNLFLVYKEKRKSCGGWTKFKE